jgi:hypothetical protein
MSLAQGHSGTPHRVWRSLAERPSWPREADFARLGFAVQGKTVMSTIVLIILIILLIGGLPSWPYSRGWGYAPSGILGVILIIVIILLLTGRF